MGTPYTNGDCYGSGGVAPYTWSVAEGALPDGLALGSSTTTTVSISGTPTKAGTFTFTLRITDADGLSAMQDLSITISPAVAPLILTTLSPLSNGTSGSPYSQTLAAAGGVQPYTWSVATGSILPVGLTLSSSGLISGTPTTPGTTTFTVNVTDSETPTPQTASKLFSLTVNNQAALGSCAGSPTGHESRLIGQYAFLVQGFEARVGVTPQPVAITGSFAADGTGKIANSELDLNHNYGSEHDSVNASQSLYAVGADPTGSGDLGCVQLYVSSELVLVFHLALGPRPFGILVKGQVIDFNDSVTTPAIHSSGILRLQDRTAFLGTQLKANYAFGLDGTDFSPGHYGLVGSFTFDNSTGNITSGYADLNDAGATSLGLSGLSGTISGLSPSTGRATGSLSAGSTFSYPLVFYIVNRDEMFALATSTLTRNRVLSGRMLSTGAPGSFSQASLTGNYVWHESGSLAGVSNVTLGLVNVSDPNLFITMYQYDGTTPTPQSIQAAYSVDATSGRTTVSAGPLSHVMYLTTPTDFISAFVLGQDNSAGFGFFEASTGAPYTTAGLARHWSLGTEDPSDSAVPNWAGVATVATNGIIQGTVDAKDLQGVHPGMSITYTLTISDPSGLGNLGANTVAITNGTKIFYIDETGVPAVIRLFELTQ